MPSGGTDVAGAIGLCLRQAESAHRAAVSAVSEAEDMLEQARVVGVTHVIEDVEFVTEALERISNRIGDLATALNDVLAEVDKFSGARGDGPRSHDRTPPMGGPETPAMSMLLPAKTDGLTLPTRKPDPMAVPRGTPEVAPRAKAPKQMALRLQKRSGEQLAQAGFDIDYLEEVPHQPSPDFSVEGRNFDCYAPQAGTGLDAIRRKLKQKIDNRQADRFVLNLDQTSHTIDDVRHHLNRKAPRSLQEVIVIKDGVVAWAWPPL